MRGHFRLGDSPVLEKRPFWRQQMRRVPPRGAQSFVDNTLTSRRHSTRHNCPQGQRSTAPMEENILCTSQRRLSVPAVQTTRTRLLTTDVAWNSLSYRLLDG